MPTLVGRWLTATKNADGSVMLEMCSGNFPASASRITITLSSAEATALDAVLTGSTGAKATASHASEKAALGENH